MLKCKGCNHIVERLLRSPILLQEPNGDILDHLCKQCIENIIDRDIEKYFVLIKEQEPFVVVVKENRDSELQQWQILEKWLIETYNININEIEYWRIKDCESFNI